MDSENPEFDIKKWDDALDQFEKELGLPNVDLSKIEPVAEYLNMPRSVLSKLGPSDCAEIAFILKTHAMHIQKALNRETARITYAKNSINQIICSEENNYGGNWSSSREQAIKNNIVAKKLNQIVKYSQMRSDRLAFISKSLTSLADTLHQIQFARTKNG